MAIRIKSVDEMIREIIASLQAGERGRPAFTLLLGSGFSFPIIPTPTEMIKGDIAWWRYCKSRQIGKPFRHRAEVIADGKAVPEEINAFERGMWKPIHAIASANGKPFPLTVDGLPDLTDPTATGLAYQAVMADGLMNNKMRRQYLRDAIARSHPRVNAAHIFLASILEAQETWDWGAPFCRTIFTTNFDPLLQRSLQLVNKLYYMTDRPDVLEPPDDSESDAIHLVYTHGSVHRYDLLNTEDQIEYARKQNAPTLIDYFKRHGVVVIGYSGWADTTMEALSSCASFDANLYWCDIHSASDAESRLRPEVVKILEAREKNAYYVPIEGADETVRLLHRELKLGQVPEFILSPITTMIAQLNSIEVPHEDVTSDNKDVTGLSSTSLANLLASTLTRLEVAKVAFDDPSVVRLASQHGQDEVARALVAQLMSDAFVAHSQGEIDRAIDLWTSVINTEVVPGQDRATALFNRGVTWGQQGEAAKEIADYTAVIDMADAPAHLKAKTLVYRGITWGQQAEVAKEIADYTAVIDMVDAPAEQKANALRNRGVTWEEGGEVAKAIADYNAVIDMVDAPAAEKANALLNRGFTWGKRGDATRAIADYTTAIDMADAPADQKAQALLNRGLRWSRQGEVAKAIADYTAVIDMADASAEQKAKAFLNRGWAIFSENDDAEALITDSEEALALRTNDVRTRANLGLGLLLTGRAEDARTQYEGVLSQASDKAQLQEAIADLEGAVSKRGQVAGAAEILDRLRRAFPGDTLPVESAPSG